MAMPLPSFVVFVDKNIKRSNTQEYGILTSEQEHILVFQDEKRALKAAEQLSNQNPGSNVHILRTFQVVVAKPGPREVVKINEKGEILPQ